MCLECVEFKFPTFPTCFVNDICDIICHIIMSLQYCLDALRRVFQVQLLDKMYLDRIAQTLDFLAGHGAMPGSTGRNRTPMGGMRRRL